MPNKLYALIGSPLSHSFSESYFNDFFLREHLTNCHFINIELPNKECLFAFVEAVKKNAVSEKYNKEIFSQNKALAKYNKEIFSSLQGFCITMPYKQTIIPLLDTISEQAKDIGAVNCVKVTRQDNAVSLHGENTDWIGFSSSLPKELNSSSTKALILGSGGAMLSVAYALKQKGIDYKVVSRKKHKEDNFTTYSELTKEIIVSHTLIINATPCGMAQLINQTPPLNTDFLTSQHTVFDLIYNPERTLLLTIAAKKGSHVINGSKMLYSQAAENWKIWNSKNTQNND